VARRNTQTITAAAFVRDFVRTIAVSPMPDARTHSIVYKVEIVAATPKSAGLYSRVRIG
jgi:hypothetical protein